MTERGELRRLMEQAMHLADPDEEMNYGELTLAALRALDAEGFVVVACPPGGRVVVDRTEKPCARCSGRGTTCATRGCNGHRCSVCAGAGVVEATTTYGLPEAALVDPDAVERAIEAWINSNGIDAKLGRPDHELAHKAMRHQRLTHDMPPAPSARELIEAANLAAVALPEETPHA